MQLQDGRVVPRKAHRRSYPETDNFDPLSDKWAEAFNKKRLNDTHPDVINTSRVVFIKPVNIWAKHPDKYDVYKLDCDSLPEYSKIPQNGWPYQIIKVKGKFYVANESGHFKRYFPPKQVDKLAKYLNRLEFVEDKSTGNIRPKQINDYTRDELREIAKEKGITNYSGFNKKQLANLIIKKYESNDEKLNYLRRLKLSTEKEVDSAKSQWDKDYWNRELEKTKKELEELSETKTKKEKWKIDKYGDIIEEPKKVKLRKTQLKKAEKELTKLKTINQNTNPQVITEIREKVREITRLDKEIQRLENSLYYY